ncbi:UNVERIFIED_CONTAM: hypothetical protein Sradi_5878500 [Sesamum radiatum]|uniref:Uncharacterized protein n=1 Tax=Sesamum radiatum TaxID=300843 RepID=A0AAW2KQX8_SESRA
MAEEDETDPCFSKLSFPVLPLPAPTMAMHSPDHPSGTATPPLQTLASVPFKWEEQPGKPRPCTDIIPFPQPSKPLELPPCRLDPAHKMPSPTTVLDGPYNVARPKFSSFRFFREAHDSFDSRSSDSPESAVDVLLGKRSSGRRRISRPAGFFRRTLRFKTGGKKEVDDGDCFSTTGCESYESSSSRVKMEGKMRRSGSFSSSSQPTSSTHLWVTKMSFLVVNLFYHQANH